MNGKPMKVFDRFPEKIEDINRLIAEDPDFFAICEDYEDCIRVLRFWTESQKPEAKSRLKEYRLLVRKLEEEIEQLLLK